MDINTAVSTYCDQYYTKEALFRLLRTNKIDPGNITISDDELNILVSTDQYARFVTLQIAENLKARFTANKSTVYRQRYLNNEADLLSKAIAPFIASSYIPDERREGRVTGINGVHTNLRARGKMLETAIDYCLTVYHEHGYMPQLDQTLKPVGAILPSGFSRTGSIDIRGGNVDSVSLQDLHSVIKEVAWNAGIRAGVKSLTKKQKIARLQSKYGISSDEAERIYEKFLEEFSYINILQKDNGKSYERPLLERHGIYPRLYLWQYILNDTRAKRKGSLLDIPHTWRMAAKIGFTSAISSGRWGNVRDASAYRDTIFGKIFEHKKIEYMGAVMSFVAKEEERTLPLVVSRERKRALKGRRLWGADKTNPYLYSDYIDSQVFIKANSKKISDRLEETVSERNSVLKWFQKTKNAKAIKAYKKPPSKKSKKRRGLNFLDLILAVPALVIDAITFLATDAALAGVSVLGKLGIVSEDSFLRTIFSGNMEGGLWDKILLSWDGMKFTFSGLKFVLKDSIVGAIPGAIVAVLSGSPLLGGIVSFTMFAPKFFGDFTQMFAMSGPAGDIVTKIVEDFGEKSLSGGEILVKSLGSGVYIGAPLFILSALFGLPIGTAALITVGVVGVRAADLAIFEKVLSPRFIDAGAIDASTAQEVLFKSKYLLNFGTPSLGLVIAGAVTGNIPLLILGGAGFTTSAVSDFFRNSLFDSMSIKSGTDLVSSIHGVTTFTLGPAIIGGAIGGPVGAVIGGAIGGVTGISFTLLKHTVSDIAIDPRMRVFAEDESKMIEAQRKLISFNRNSFTTDAERGILRNFDPRTGVDGNIDSLLRSKGYDFKIQDLRDWGLNDADIERLFRGRATFSGTVIGVKNFNFELKSLKENVEAVRGEFLRDFVNEDKLATDLGKGTSATAPIYSIFL
ncbi:hypothetical protein M1145_02720 [Patescibacteria group bacterium]|nr:hypothetical protein [Patescibacteria group bacterium]